MRDYASNSIKMLGVLPDGQLPPAGLDRQSWGGAKGTTNTGDARPQTPYIF